MTEPITSLQNNKVKLAGMLITQKQTRQKERKIALEGVRLVTDAFENGLPLEYALHTPEVSPTLLAELTAGGVALFPVLPSILTEISDTQTPQGIIAVAPLPQHDLPEDADKLLILDAISDPGNLGTLLRTAAGAGVQAVILAPGCVDPYNPKVLRAGMGAHFRVTLVSMAWEDIASELRVDNIYLAEGTGDVRYDQADWRRKWALVIGSEAHGATVPAQQVATQRLFIPMANQTESLNAAMAATVVLFESARQRNFL
ncbi:MAG: TrmH family RNA methyltransferase [Phototrophicaceae bacterium]